MNDGKEGAKNVQNNRSPRPFTSRYVHPISQNDSPALKCCPYLSRSGDLFYVSNQASFDQMRDVPVTVYKNGQRLDLGTGNEENNPHYCEAKDELWFDCPGDAKWEGTSLPKRMETGYNGVDETGCSSVRGCAGETGGVLRVRRLQN